MDQNLTAVTASAFSQARGKLLYKAFIKLNDFVVNLFYKIFNYKKYKGYRLLAIDGSITRLPDDNKLKVFFRRKIVTNQKGNWCYTYYEGLISVMYDVLNNIVVDCDLVSQSISERIEVLKHSLKMKVGDLLLFDRGYAAFELFSYLIHHGIEFICRCKVTHNNEIKDFMKENVNSKIIKLSASHHIKKSIQEKGLPETIKVRLVKVILNTGEIEVLITSLIDEETYYYEELGRLYYKRWGIETFYDIMKNRLSLENFSGKSDDAIFQDFYSIMFLCSLESVLTTEANKELKAKCETKKNKYGQKVNRSDSFSVIKDEIMTLFVFDVDLEYLLETMTRLFKENPVLIRNHRNPPRKEKRAYHLHETDYIKRRKKII